MIDRRFWAGPTALILLASASVQAGYPAPSYVYRSNSQEAISTHVLIGKIRAFRQLEPGVQLRQPGPFEAELEVVRVEKGQGVHPGDIVSIRFHSSLTLVDIEKPFPPSGCSSGEVQVTPSVGDPARIYAVLDNKSRFLTDYPQAFFRLTRKENQAGAPDLVATIRSHSIAILLSITAAIVLPLVCVARVKRKFDRIALSRPVALKGLRNLS